MESARDAVHRRLARQARRFPDLDITPIETEGLSPRDAAFAHALDDLVKRRWLTLKFLLERVTRKPLEELEPRMQAVLLAGAAQVVLMDRVPPFAATNEAVEWAKRRIRPGAGALVNAALRAVIESLAPAESAAGDGAGAPGVPTAGGQSGAAARGRTIERAARRGQWTDRRDELPMPDGSALVLKHEALPLDPMQRLAVATSHPVDLLRLLSRSMPMREVRRIALHGLAHPPVILNTAHARAPLPGAADEREGGARLTPHDAPGHHVFNGPHEALVDLLRRRSDIWVQDPASSLAVMSVSDLRPDLVIDVCAGRGTKTRQLAAAFPDAKIIATDVDNERFKVLRETFAGSAQVQAAPYGDLGAWRGRADLALIDTPCSNTGVLARRVEARYRASEDRTRELTGIQRQIVADSIPLLMEGARRGRILYSTCSLDPRENQEIAKWTSRWHALAVSRENARLPSGGPGEAPERYSDGSYAALLG